MVADLTRTYRCPQCGFDGFKAGPVKCPVDVNVAWYCPVCFTNHGLHVQLEETSDPRDEAVAS